MKQRGSSRKKELLKLYLGILKLNIITRKVYRGLVGDLFCLFDWCK